VNRVQRLDPYLALLAADLAKSTEGGTGGGFAQDLFDKQKPYFAAAVTKTCEWTVDQVHRHR
jgi:hypothetical protein